MLELNRNPENYFAEVEQAALSPANVVPGISHSPDKMLQARIFSYAVKQVKANLTAAPNGRLNAYRRIFRIIRHRRLKTLNSI